VRKLLVAIAALAVLSPVASARAEGSISISLTEAPSNRADDPRARVYIVDHVAPGTTIDRKVKVTNDSDAANAIDTYAAAASIKDGEFRFGDGHKRNELTTWTTIEPSTAEYGPHESKVVQVTIAVPQDASEGERYAVVWASVSSTPNAGGGITSVNRVGIRVYLSVGPGGEPASDFQVKGIQARRAATGEPQIVATVENTGGRALDLSGKLRMTNGPGGLSAGPFNVKLGTTLGVGQTEPVEVTLAKALPAGPWHARLDLESGLVKRHTEAQVTFPKHGSGPVIKIQRKAKTDTVSILLFVLVFAAPVSAFYVWRIRRHRAAVSL
jgi:hypothetical protein